MTKTIALLAAALLAPALAGAFGGNYGVHCSHAQQKAGKCKPAGVKNSASFTGTATLGTRDGSGAPGASAAAPHGTATPMAGAETPALPALDPATAAAANAALKDIAPGADGKCPDGTTAVPGLNGTTRCVPNGASGH